MKKYEDIGYDFCPTSYWDDTSVEQAVLRGVKGKHRRKVLSKALAEGKFEKVSEEIQSAEISNELRDRLGQIHPSLMGGEYLPSYQREETEIGRIELESTTSESSAFEPGGRTGKSITGQTDWDELRPIIGSHRTLPDVSP